MASAFAHAVAATAIGTLLGVPWRMWSVLSLGVVCAILPDLDSVGFWLGIPYEHPLGHRGLSHSIAFAALVSWCVVRIGFRDSARGERHRFGWFLFLATASHGVLDAMTNGGLGVAFFAPFDNTRYFFAFRPIEVSPLEPQKFFTRRGVGILATEMVWVGLPSVAAMSGVTLWRWRRSVRNSSSIQDVRIQNTAEPASSTASPGKEREN